MTRISGTLLKRLAAGLAGGLTALPLICGGSDAALAQPAAAVVTAPQPPQLPPPLPQQLPQAGSLTPLCCVPSAPTPLPPAAAAPAAAAPAAAPARRN